MKNVLLICFKEFKNYFVSPIGYAVMALFAFLFGITFYSSTSQMVNMGFRAQMMGQQQPMSVNEIVIRPMLGFVGTILLFVIPMITMRLIAEEKRNGTIELLLTSPIKDMEIILGKWLAAVLLYACMIGMSVLNVAMLFIWGKPDVKPVLVAYLGLLLEGGCLLALGIFISALTKNQIVAAGATFFFSLVLYLLNYYTEFLTGVFWQGLNYVSIYTHTENFNKGVIDSKDVIFYLSMTFFFLFLTSRSMESLRWRS
jgi:ABC-2 type transport system permease protein